MGSEIPLSSLSHNLIKFWIKIEPYLFGFLPPSAVVSLHLNDSRHMVDCENTTTKLLEYQLHKTLQGRCERTKYSHINEAQI